LEQHDDRSAPTAERFLDSVTGLISSMRDVFDSMSRERRTDERILASMKRWLNSINALQELTIGA
jgi:hypothetical protein